MDGRPIWTYCDEAGDYVVPNVLSPRDLVSRPDIMDGTVPHTIQTSRQADCIEMRIWFCVGILVLNQCVSFLLKYICNWHTCMKLDRFDIRGV